MVHGELTLGNEEHYVIDTDHHFIIDPVSRAVTNAENKKTLLMQNDHNSERFSFELDREIEGHDMYACDKVEVHYININASTREQNVGVYEVNDLQVAGSNEDKVVFTWLVSEEATVHPGPLNFLILLSCTDKPTDTDKAIDTYRWHTGINNTMIISEGINNGEAILERYADILVQWQKDLLTKNYVYESAVKHGFKGTEESWNRVLTEWAINETLYNIKQNTLGWVSEEDIDAMFGGAYEGVDEDEGSEGDDFGYTKLEIVDGTLIIGEGVGS